MLRLVVLGNSGAVPAPGRVPSCFAIKSGNTFLFDCCEGAQRQMMKYRISYAKVNAIFFSHLHADHILGIFGLIQTMNLHDRTDELLLFGPHGIKELMGTVLSLRYLRPKFPVRIVEVTSSKRVFEDKLIRVSAFKVDHKVEALGYVIEEQPINKFYEKKAKDLGIKGKLFREIQDNGFVKIGRKKIKLEDVTYVKKGKRVVYTGDSLPCSAIERAAKDAELLVHDSTFADDSQSLAKKKYHSTARQAAESARKAKVKALLLTHFSNRYADLSVLLAEAKEVFPNVDIAEAGKEILI
ncbi:ribonuclease Z [Candidatus Micrarchaeota archaeon]|nr:ribonuclease Z [Candidatus Micrarchaeota archaeon]